MREWCTSVTWFLCVCCQAKLAKFLKKLSMQWLLARLPPIKTQSCRDLWSFHVSLPLEFQSSNWCCPQMHVLWGQDWMLRWWGVTYKWQITRCQSMRLIRPSLTKQHQLKRTWKTHSKFWTVSRRSDLRISCASVCRQKRSRLVRSTVWPPNLSSSKHQSSFLRRWRIYSSYLIVSRTVCMVMTLRCSRQRPSRLKGWSTRRVFWWRCWVLTTCSWSKKRRGSGPMKNRLNLDFNSCLSRGSDLCSKPNSQFKSEKL